MRLVLNLKPNIISNNTNKKPNIILVPSTKKKKKKWWRGVSGLRRIQRLKKKQQMNANLKQIQIFYQTRRDIQQYRPA